MIYSITAWDIMLSCLRFLLGLSCGTVVGAALALAGHFAGRLFLPAGASLQFLRALPILGLLPLVQITFGISEIGKVLLITFAATFPVYFSVQYALAARTADQELLFVGLRVPLISRWRLDVWPRLRRGIIYGVEISIGLSWITVVAAKSIGTLNRGFWAGGLGEKLFLSFDVNQIGHGVFALALFGVLGLITGYLWLLPKRYYGY